LAYPQNLFYTCTKGIMHCMVLFCVKREALHLTDIQKTINKVLLALRMKGIVYKVNTKQFFSKKDQRFVTMYIVWETNEYQDGEKFYSKVKMLLWLVERYKEVVGNDSGASQGKPE